MKLDLPPNRCCSLPLSSIVLCVVLALRRNPLLSPFGKAVAWYNFRPQGASADQGVEAGGFLLDFFALLSIFRSIVMIVGTKMSFEAP